MLACLYRWPFVLSLPEYGFADIIPVVRVAPRSMHVEFFQADPVFATRSVLIQLTMYYVMRPQLHVDTCSLF